jgi:hypothetical protein
VSADILFSNNITHLKDINITVHNGSNFFRDNRSDENPNLLINYLIDIKQSNKSNDSLIFCFNILKLYNHINNENLYIYLNLFNTNSTFYFNNNLILTNTIIKTNLDHLDKDLIKDINSFYYYVSEYKYKKANELLNKYNSDNDIHKKVNKYFLKLIFVLGYNFFYDSD